jgi:NADH-quinone oxidoreductase subunit N
MFLTDWLTKLNNSLSSDLVAFIPESILCLGIVCLLLIRLFRVFDRTHLGWVAFVTTVLALLAALVPALTFGNELTDVKITLGKRENLFTGMLVYDSLMMFMRWLLLSFSALVIWLSLLTGIPDKEDSADFYCLLLGATLGMLLMTSANHLLMVYIAVEMASVPSYALAGFLKGKRQSSEAALKYVVYGGGASGVMLYGISLLAGKFGTAYLPDIAQSFAILFGQGANAGADPIILIGSLFILIGIAFKLAAFPFHFWCPDVFEGAAAEIGAFLSVASKGAALALLARFTLELFGRGIDTPTPMGTSTRIAQYYGPMIGVFAALTATFGNLAAYFQTNLKRLLAFSTIAHAGYMMMALAAFSGEAIAAVLFYLVAYLFMNLGAFAIVAFLRNLTGSEDISSFQGLVRRSPVMVITLAFFLVSLVGIPPLIGFAAKFQVFAILFNGFNFYRTTAPTLSITLFALLVIGGINTVISLVYYINVLKVMVLDKPADETEAPLKVPLSWSVFAVFLAAAVLVPGLYWTPLSEASAKGASSFVPTKLARAPSG